MNKITLKAEGDKYKVFINGVSLENIAKLELIKNSNGFSEVTLTIKCKVETKLNGNDLSPIKEIDEIGDVVELAKKIKSGKWIILNCYYPSPDKPLVVIGRTV